MLIKARLLVFLVLNRYGLACKYRIISQILLFNCMQIVFSDMSGIAFSFSQDQITTHTLSQLFATSQMVCHMMS